MITAIKIAIILIAGPLFLVAAGLHLYARIKLKPSEEEINSYYFEFEHMNPELARYRKWTRITYIVAIASMALLFVALVI